MRLRGIPAVARGENHLDLDLRRTGIRDIQFGLAEKVGSLVDGVYVSTVGRVADTNSG